MEEQTAVEWLYETIWKEWNFSFSSNVLEKAKEIEKQQIVDAYDKGWHDGVEDLERILSKKNQKDKK
jgi:hypothetical protein